MEAEVVESLDGEFEADDEAEDESDSGQQKPDGGRESAAPHNTIFGMPRFVFTMTVGIAAALLIVIVLQQVVGPVSDDIEDLQRFPDLGRRHLAAGETFDDYNSNPPTSGPQNVEGVPPGIYGPEEEAPFNFIPAAADLLPVLEAGGIVIHYRADLVPDGGLLALRNLLDRIGARNILLTANRSIDDPVVATAWGHLFPLAALEEDFIEQLELFLGEDEGFYQRFLLETDPVTRDLGLATELSPSSGESDGE